MRSVTRPSGGAEGLLQRPHRCCCACGMPRAHVSKQSRVHSLQATHRAFEILQTRLQQAASSTLAVGLSLLIAGSTVVPPPAAALTVEQQFFLEAWRAVDRAYYDKSFNGQSWFKLRETFLKAEPMRSRSETYAAVRKALAQLDDPFTRFLGPQQYQALKRSTAGRPVVGVGLEVGFENQNTRDSRIVVIAPSSGGPAEAAGIAPREVLQAVDGTTTQGLSLFDVGDLLQGPEGSQVTLTLQGQDQQPREVQLSRRRINTNPVNSRLCGTREVASSAGAQQEEQQQQGLAYIRISTFSKATAEGVRAAIQQLQAQGASRYVLDIRNNGGGLFPAGVDVARMWLDTGDIVLIADDAGVKDSYEADGSALEARAPLAVLVNHGTASASEVLAGALQDNKRATIVGETTFGKGLIQTIVEMSDGSAVVATAARYRTPAGTDINKVGIQPDVQLQAQPPLEPVGFCKYAGPNETRLMFAKAPKQEQLEAVAMLPNSQLFTQQEGRRPAGKLTLAKH